jgi:hypothetical protein
VKKVLWLIVFVTLACSTRKKTTPENLELTEKYTAKSGLAVVHHPKLLVPSQVNDSVTRLVPASYGIFDAGDEIFVSTTKTPATTVLDDYVRILHDPFAADMAAWKETSRTAASCLGVYPGLELTATFLAKDGTRRRYWSCTFLHSPHGYKVSYVVNETAAAKDAPLLRKVVDATEVKSAP